MDTNITEKSARFFAWLSVFFNFVAHNYSVVLSVICAIAALIASFYSVVVNRARLKLINKEIEHVNGQTLDEKLGEEE